MLVEIYSDIVCPWCYIGQHQFREALDRSEHGDQVETVWRAFELDPRAPAEPTSQSPNTQRRKDWPPNAGE